MSIDLSKLDNTHRILFNIPLRPIQGDRFQPTGFPSLGAATYQTKDGTKLLVESAQSMANRLEATIWDEAAQKPVEDASDISYIRVERNGQFLTSSILEAHRINSPYILSDKGFFEELKESIGDLGNGPFRKKLLETLLKYDANSLIHGVFLEKIAGRLRIDRSLSAFVEAEGVELAASGGVKNDHVDPSGSFGSSKTGFGNVPFARDEYTAQKIVLYVNLDLDQIRGYGLGQDATRLLIVLALYKVRALLSGSLRFRTACDLEPEEDTVSAVRPSDFVLPSLPELSVALKEAIQLNKPVFKQTVVQFNDNPSKSKEEKSASQQ